MDIFLVVVPKLGKRKEPVEAGTSGISCGQKRGGTKQRKLMPMMVPISLEEDASAGWFESFGLGDEIAFPALPPEGPQPKKTKGDSSKGT